jgi:hypothetical protein
LGAFRDIYLSMFDESDGTEYIYTAKVLQVGVMKAYIPRAAGLNFSVRRHAFRRGRRLPRLLPERLELADHGLVVRKAPPPKRVAYEERVRVAA